MALQAATAGPAADAGAHARLQGLLGRLAEGERAQLGQLRAHLPPLRAGTATTVLPPKAPVTVAGFRVLQLYRQRRHGPRDLRLVARHSTRARPGSKSCSQETRPLRERRGMKSCELELAPQRTAMLMASDAPKTAST